MQELAGVRGAALGTASKKGDRERPRYHDVTPAPSLNPHDGCEPGSYPRAPDRAGVTSLGQEHIDASNFLLWLRTHRPWLAGRLVSSSAVSLCSNCV